MQPLVTSTSLSEPASPFARSCQASHILSRVLRHVRDQDSDADILYQEAIQLNRTLQALSSVIANESLAAVEAFGDTTAQLPLFTAAGICFSALFSLYDCYSCPEHSREEHRGHQKLMEMQKQAIEGLKEMTDQVVQLARRVQAVAELGGMLKTSPFISDCLYQAAATSLWGLRETGNQDYETMAAVTRRTLELLSTRWRCPGKFSGLVEL